MASSNTINELYSLFNEFRLEEKFCDIIVRVENRTFACHRVILASALKYFRITFSGEYSEAEKKEIELKGIEADDFELLLTYIYGGSINLNQDNAYRMLKMSDYLCIKNLEDFCIQYFIQNADVISLSSAVDVFIYATRVGKDVLIEKFSKCMVENFVNVSKYRKFAQIPGSDLLKLFRDPNMDKKNWTVTVDFLAQWMKFQSTKEQKLLPELLDVLNLAPREWFIEMISLIMSKNSEIESSNIEEQSGKIEYNKRRTIAEEFFFIDPDDGKSKISYPFKLYTVDSSLSGNYQYYSTHLYRFEEYNHVQLLEPLYDSFVDNNSNISTTRPYFYKSTLVDGLCYTFTITLYASKYSYYYKPFISYNLKPVQNLKNYCIGVKFAIGTKLVTCGSNIYIVDMNNFLKFDCQTYTWAEMSKNNLIETENSNLISHNNSLYLVGGNGADSHSEANGKFFQQYDINGGKWLQNPPLIYARNKSASCVYNDILYVTGGDDLMYHKKYIECFDFRANKWQKLETLMPEAKMNHILLGNDNQLWFFGGHNYNRTNIVNNLTWYSYNLANKTWSDIYSIPSSYKKFKIESILDVVADI